MRSNRVAVLGMLIVALVPAVGVTANRPSAARAASADVVAEEASAVAAAGRSGKRVEVAGLRTETSQTFANPGGTFTKEISLEPVRVRRPDKSWAPIDTRLRAAPDGSVMPVATAVGLRFSGGGEGPAVVMSQQGRELSLGWHGALPTPVLSGDTATYSDVLPDVDLRLVALPRGFSEQLVVKTRQAGLSQVGFDVGKGLTLRADAAGGLAAVDAGGRRVFGAPAPMMWDAPQADGGDPVLPSSGQRPVGVQVSGGRLTLTPDPGLLTSPQTRFPVVIDPTFTYGSPSWTEVNAYDPDSSTWRTPDNTLAAGYQNYVSPATKVRSFVHFGLDSRIWSTHILTAYLKMHETWSASHACSASAVEVHGTGSFSSTTTWNHQPTWSGVQDSTSAAYGNPAMPSTCASPNWVSFNVLGSVANAAKYHTGVTFGIKAADESEPTAWRKYSASGTYAPLLTVEYNHPPAVPAASTMHTVTPNSDCFTSSSTASRVNITPTGGVTLKATVSDVDTGDKVTARFEFWKYGQLSAMAYWTSGLLGLDSTHNTTVTTPVLLKNVTLVNGALYGWKVKVTDNHNDSSAWTPYCWLKQDSTHPNPPVVTSADYPTGSYEGYTGKPGTFAFTPGSSTDTDIGHYEYWIDSATHQTVAANSLNPVSPPLNNYTAPQSYGPHDMHVRAVDTAGNPSDETLYHFYVKSPDDAVARYPLDEGSGTTADGGATVPALMLSGGASWTADGKVDGGLHFDGVSGEASTAVPVVNTAQDFSVCAWARLAAKNQQMAVVSQAGTVSSAFHLVYSPLDRWAFGMRRSDVSGATEDAVFSLAAPSVNTWTHLCGVYSGTAHTIMLYVNGVAQGAPVSHPIAWQATGAQRAGAMLYDGTLINYLNGDVDEVRLYSRALAGGEVGDIVNHDNAAMPVGQWHLDDGSDASGKGHPVGLTAPGATIGTVARYPFDEGGGTTADGGAPGRAMALDGAAAWTASGKVGGGLNFNGSYGVASTASGVVNTASDFTVTAWVRLNSKDHWQAAVSQAGSTASGFYLGYVNDIDRWTFGMPETDTGAYALDSVAASAAPTVGQWSHLTGVYQASTRKMTFYVDGVQQGSPVTRNTPWSATGPTMIGAVRWYGMSVNFLNGDVDEVRLYNRALAGGEISDIVNHDQAGTPLRHWPGHRGAGLALDETGTGAASTTTAVLRTDQSFTVAAWVNLSNTDGEYTVLSQDSGDGTAYALKYEPPSGDEGQYGGWCFTVDDTICDPFGTTGTVDVQQGVDPTNSWTQVTATYDGFTHRLYLRIGGSLTATGHGYRGLPPNTTGPMQIGRDKQGVADDGTLIYEDYLPGTVDEVNTYAGVLDETDIQQLIANS